MEYQLSQDCVAYSLIRFSTKQQADGNSYRRQVAAADGFCARKCITLDRSLHEADIRKLGISGFSGEHVIKGPLRKFIAGIETGTVRPGHVLVVSEWNRLTRQVSSDALKLVLWFFEKGIGIVDLQDESYYTLDRYNSDIGLQLGLQIKISMAHQYSANLRRTITAKWEGRRIAMRAGKGIASNACARWLKAVNGEFEFIDDRVAVVRKIIAYRHLGMGRRAIATELTKDKIPTFSRGYGWHESTIAAIVRNKAMIGIYQPCKKDGSLDGPEIKGYYPRIVSDEDFWRAQWGPNNRKSPGRNTNGAKNLLKGVCKCGSCGRTLVYKDTGKDSFLICAKSRVGQCDNRYFHTYPKLEADLLSVLSLFDYNRLLSALDPALDRLAGLRAEIASKNALLQKMADDFGENLPVAFARRAQALQWEIDEKTAESSRVERDAQIANASQFSDSYSEFTEMIARLPLMAEHGRSTLRMKIKSHLDHLIESAVATDKDMRIVIRTGGYPTIEFHIHRSRIEEMVFRTIGGLGIHFPRDSLFSGADSSGEFAAYLSDAPPQEPWFLFGDDIPADGRTVYVFTED